VSVGGGAEAVVQCHTTMLRHGWAPADDGAWPYTTVRRPACPLREGGLSLWVAGGGSVGGIERDMELKEPCGRRRLDLRSGIWIRWRSQGN